MKYDSITVLNAAQDTDLLVRTDKLKLLFHQSFPALFVSIFAALVLCWILWGHADSVLLMSWFMLLFLSSLGRLALFIFYFRAKPSGLDLLNWEKPYIATLMTSSLIWGFGSLFMLAGASLADQAFLLFTLIGLAGGAVSTYSAKRFMAAASMGAVLMPATVWLFFQPEKIQIGMAIGASMFMLASLRATKVMGEAMHRSFQLTHELKQARDTADFLAKTDALTGINNRRAFFENALQIISYCQRYEHPICAILFDIDHFKEINDKYGHSAGDSALKQVGDVLQKQLRKTDVSGRLGGEEFAILLPNTAPEDGKAIAEKLRQTIAEATISFRGQQLEIKASIGVACGIYDLETLLSHADSAMYQAKAQGRNRVSCHRE
jgi:diguanylate cyclase (GGDEF)-like protein